MWLFPWLSYATIALMATVILAMAFLPSTRSQFVMSESHWRLFWWPIKFGADERPA